MKSVTIEVTTLCDAKCIICPREKYQYKFKSMNFDTFKEAVNKSMTAGVTNISLGGYGEPFLNKDIASFLDYVKANFPEVMIQASSTCNCLIPNRLLTRQYEITYT